MTDTETLQIYMIGKSYQAISVRMSPKTRHAENRIIQVLGILSSTSHRCVSVLFSYICYIYI